MTIKPEVVEHVRTFVRGEREENDRIEQLLDKEGWGDNFSEFLSAVFFFAVDLRFGGRRDDAAIIQFVYELRSEDQDAAAEVDPKAAEEAITAVLDPAVPVSATPETLGRIQVYVLHKALSEARLSDGQLNALLQEAVDLVERQ